MKKYIVLSLLGLCLTAGAQTTQRFTASKANEYGISYVLPNTSVNVTLAAQRTVKTPGEFALYSEKYLDLKPVLEPSVSWTLVGAEIMPGAVADDEERYLVQFKGGNTVTMTLSEEGFPLSINDNAYVPAAPRQTSLKALPATATPLDGDAARQAMTQEMLQSRSTAKRAELAAARIYEIRQQRNDMLSFQDDNRPDGEAMRLALENLKSQEDALVAMFTGTTSTSVEIAGYTVMPPVDDESGRIVIARLSAAEGLVGADDLSGAPIYIEFSDAVDAKMPVDDKGVEKPFPKGGVAYRIPGQVTATVSYDGRDFVSQTFDVAQYGVVYGVEPKLFTDKKAPASLRFAPLTGAIVELGTAIPNMGN